MKFQSNKKHGVHPKIALFGTLKIMVASALLIAISIVCGKYLQIPIGDSIRFSFENAPILFAGMVFGPVVGAVVGVAADLIGCLIVGWTPIPLVSVGAASIGILGGLIFLLLKKLPLALKVLLAVVTSHVVGSVVIKSVGLALWYGNPIPVVMGGRVLNYLIVGVLDFLVLYLLLGSKAVQAQLAKLTGTSKSRDKKEKNL